MKPIRITHVYRKENLPGINTKTHTIRKRGDKYIAVSKQIQLWRRVRRKEALVLKAKAKAEALAKEEAKTDREKFESWSMFGKSE